MSIFDVFRRDAPCLSGGLAIAAWLGGVGPTLADAYQSTVPHTRALTIQCAVADDLTTRNCHITYPGKYPDRAMDEKILKDVDSHPEYLADATPGATVLVIVRRNPGSEAGRALALLPTMSPPSVEPSLIADPDWRILPRREEINRYFPERAVRMGINGTASVICSVSPAGDLVGCWQSAENPTGQAFGEALLKFSIRLQMKAVTKSGAPIAGRAIRLSACFVTNARGEYGVKLMW